ncbi:acyltransferase [Opitutaceae bacterium EW11]|nr:acyltransferase [Opitutaceae bacterium EW11]
MSYSLNPPSRPASLVDHGPSSISTGATLASKPHYEILDGLRGVAAIAVVLFHFFEAHSGGDVFKQKLNHGYLAVDFFFMLSGFVIGYAYDDRWKQMSLAGFFRRRLIRLQPLVIAGTVLGAILYYFQASDMFPKIAGTPVWQMVLIAIAGVLMIPLPPSAEIRGWGETYPLNGPAWSLFFEYVANILYATALRRLSVRALTILVFVTAGVSLQYLLSSSRADLVGGWDLSATGLRIGFTRLGFPFLAGLLLCRLGWRRGLPQGFWLCSFALLALLALPRFGSPAAMWPNAVYEAACILVLFPLLIVVGVGSGIQGKRSRIVCGLLGRLSYPIYILHYPLVYLYFSLLPKGHGGLLAASLLFCGILTIAWVALRFYDEPLRARLSRGLSRCTATSPRQASRDEAINVRLSA